MSDLARIEKKEKKFLNLRDLRCVNPLNLKESNNGSVANSKKV